MAKNFIKAGKVLLNMGNVVSVYVASYRDDCSGHDYVRARDVNGCEWTLLTVVFRRGETNNEAEEYLNNLLTELNGEDS